MHEVIVGEIPNFEAQCKSGRNLRKQDGRIAGIV